MLKGLKSAEGKVLKMPYSKMALSMEYKGITLRDSDYWYWCVSPIWGDDGMVHIFCSRWPVTDKEMELWVTDSEVCHFIADNPEGPFTYVETVLSNENIPNNKRYKSPHNPNIKKVDDKYVLSYIVHDLELGYIKGMSSCLAYSDSLNGPWKFYGDDGVVVRPSNEEGHWTNGCRIGTDNPAFMKIDNKYYMFFHSGKILPEDMHYGYAVSDSLTGKYTICDSPKMDNIGYIEDATCFEINGKVFLLTTDNMGKNTGIFGAGILWEMIDGEFKLSNAEIGFGVLSDYIELPETTTYYDNDFSTKLERPGILFKDGKPTYFYGATRTSILGSGISECYVMKILND